MLCVLVGDRVQWLRGPVTRLDHLCAVRVVFDGSGLDDVLCFHEWNEIFFPKSARDGPGFFLTDAN